MFLQTVQWYYSHEHCELVRSKGYIRTNVADRTEMFQVVAYWTDVSGDATDAAGGHGTHVCGSIAGTYRYICIENG